MAHTNQTARPPRLARNVLGFVILYVLAFMLAVFLVHRFPAVQGSRHHDGHSLLVPERSASRAA